MDDKINSEMFKNYDITSEAIEKVIKDCDSICANPTKTLWEKCHYITTVCYAIQCTPYGHECPFCGYWLTEQNFNNELDICQGNINSDYKLEYKLYFPCCNKQLYNSTKYNSPTFDKDKFLQKTRVHYWQAFVDKEKEYREIKNKYKTICDLIYEREQEWKKN